MMLEISHGTGNSSFCWESVLPMTTIDNACDYIILKLTEGGAGLNLLKLQKLLYYVQAWSLALSNQRMFEGKFQAWVHGPVNRYIYDRFRNDKSLYSAVGTQDIREGFSLEHIRAEDQTFIDEVLEAYAPFTGTQLEDLTHREEPWITARQGLLPSARCENEIDERVMATYYANRV